MDIVKKITRLHTFLLGRYYPKKLAEILYRKKFNKNINWSKPLDINEKINWIAFNTNTRFWTKLADKYEVREYVKEKGYADPNKREEFLSIMKERGEAKGFESVWLRNDGSKVYIRESAKTFYNEDGSVKYYEGTVEDITEQELAKEALLESEELFSKLIQTVPDLIIRTDIEGNITFVNEAVLLSHLNVKKENVIGKNIMSFISERDLPFAMENTNV